MKSAPLWLDAGALAGIEFPAGETVDADVAVVGGGLTGLSAAYHLAAARPGARVALLEADNLGGGASGRNTGMLGPGVGQSLPALAQRLGREPAAALYRSTLEAVSDVRSLCGREGIACDLQMTGQLLRARSRGDRRRLARQAALMAELELPFDGNILFEDLEALDLKVTADPRAIRDTYRQVVQEFVADMRKKCHDNSVDYQLISTATPLDRALASYLSWRE